MSLHTQKRETMSYDVSLYNTVATLKEVTVQLATMY